VIYVRKGTTSDYVDANKVDLSSGTSDQASTDAIDELLQGTWEYCDENTGSVEIFMFHNGTLDYMNYLIGAEEKVSTSEGTYQITDENLITTINHHDTYFDYQVKNGALSISWYVDSGVDKGNTRVFEKTADRVYEQSDGDANQMDTSVSGGTATATTGEKNALEDAKAYLNVLAFSYDGLVEQLEYEGYSYSEAVYAVDHCGADWYEQAAKSAKAYLKIFSFSRSELIDQLEYDGFTYEQAAYGAKQNGY
jgi:predicted dehydrogenase